MPGLYGLSSNANISVYNTTGLYQLSNANITLGNISASNTTGLYTAQGNVFVPTNAQQLLNLLSNNGSVTFNLDPATSNQKVEAFAIGGNGGGGGSSIISIYGDISAYGQTGIPIYSTLSNVGTIAGTYGNISYVPVIRVSANGRVMSATTTPAYGNTQVAGYLKGNITIGNLTVNNNLYVKGTTVTTYTANIVSNTLFANSTIDSTSTSTGAIVSAGGLGVAANAYIGGVFTDNYYWANGQPFQSSVYSNANVASYLPVYNSTVGATQVQDNTNAALNLASTNYVQMQYDPTGTFDRSTIQNGSWAYIGAGGFTFESAVTGPQETIILHDNGNLTVSNSIITTNGVFWPNGTPYSDVYGNVQVAAYIKVDPTITGIQANVGAYETWANATFATQTALQILNANVGAYETWANIAIGSLASGANANTAAYLKIGNLAFGNITSNIVTVGPWGNNLGNQDKSGLVKIQGGTGFQGYGAILNLTSNTGVDSYGYAYGTIQSVVNNTTGAQAFPTGTSAQTVLLGNILTPNSLYVGGNAFVNSLLGGIPTVTKPVGVFEGNVLFNNYTGISQNSLIDFNSNVAFRRRSIFSGNVDIGTASGPAYLNIGTVGGGGAINTGGIINSSANIQTSEYFIGNVRTNNLTFANGAPYSIATTYGNSNVAAYLPQYTGQLGSATAISIGAGAGGNYPTNLWQQANLSIAVGFNAGSYLLQSNSIAIGTQAAQLSGASGGNVIAIGTLAAYNSQNISNSIAIGTLAGQNALGNSAIAIGTGTIAASDSIAIGQTVFAGNFGVAIGGSATIYPSAIAIGYGSNAIGANTIVIGSRAGQSIFGSQPPSQYSVAIGDRNISSYSDYSVSIGANNNLGGVISGKVDRSIIIGANTTVTSSNTIVLNASGNTMSVSSYGLYVDPVRNDPTNSSNAVFYNEATKELTYNTSSSLYGNTQVAAYLATNTDPTISNLNANSAVQATAINSINANLGAYQTYANASTSSYQTYANANAATQATSINTINANLGAYQSYANTAIQTINANLGAYETWANATFVSSAGLYSNTNVANYLPTYTGQLGAYDATNGIKIGSQAGLTNQGGGAIAIGTFQTAWQNQGSSAIAIGGDAAKVNQGQKAIAIGSLSGNAYQGGSAIAIGSYAGQTNQNINAIAIGYQSGVSGQGYGAVAIGQNAGTSNQPNNSIILNASNVALNGSNAGLYINPVRNDATNNTNAIYYNTSTNELTYTTAYGNTQVAAYLPTDPTFTGYLSFANANAATQATSINSINANLGAYQSYANTSINSINANLGAYQSYANTSINSINANLGAYQSYANTSINTLTTNAAAQAVSLNSINANLGAFETYANTTFGQNVYSNTNVAAYLPTYAGLLGGTLTTALQPNITRLDGATSVGSTAGSLALKGGTATVTLNGYGSTLGVQSTQVTTQTDFIVHQGNVTLLGDVTPGKGHLIVSNSATANKFVSTLGYFWANGVAYGTAASSYGNTDVAAYLATNTDPTISSLNANAAVQATAINTINANLGAYQTYANTSINTINANLGAFETYANATFGASSYSNVNVAAYIPTDPTITGIQANIGGSQIYANATFATKTTVQTLDANIGAYETWANASINTINANLGTLYLGNLSTQANLGAFQTYANLHFADQTYSNANVASYLPIYGGNILLGNITNDGHHWQFNADGSETYPSATAVTTAAGKMWYDSTNGSWNLGMGGGNVTQQVGEELFVYGKASSAIADSPLQIVYKTGVVGASGVITFAPTIAGITNDDVIVGVATENIALNATGRVTCFGIVHGITTNGTAYGETWADGDVIWYNPVTGNPTKTKPVAPYVKCQIGTVINAGSGGSGSFQVEIIHGTSLGGTDQNAQITSPTAAQILTYDATSQYWKNTNLNAGTNINVTTASDGNITVNNTYGNTQVAAYLPTDPTITSIQANIGGSETYANVTFATKTALQTLDANVGAFETYANATFSTGGGSSYGNSNVAAYLPVYGGNILTSNVITSNGVFWSNGVPYSTGGGGTYGNTQVAAYIPIDPTITGIQANLGAYQNYANISINTINANLGAFETYANANFITSGSTYGNANVAAYLPTYSGNLGVLGGNINLNSNNRIGPVWQSSLNTLAFIGTEKSNGVALVFEGNTGTAPIDQMFYVNKDNAQIRANNANYIWTFDKVGNLTLPGNTSAINYANGVSILSGTGGSGTYGNTQVNAYLNTTQSTPNVFNPFLLSGM